MIQGENIVCIANTSWFGNYAKSTVQILERLAKYNKILFVEYPFTFKDIISSIQGKQNAPVKRMLGIESRLYEIPTNSGTKVWNLVIPPGLPLYFLKNEKIFNFLFRYNTFIYKKALENAIDKLGMQKPILITAYNPFYGLSMLGKLNEKTHIYYCYDGVESVFFGKRIFNFEEMFSLKVPGIITTSDFLNNQKLALNKNSFVVKNGVDFPVFSKSSKKDIHNRSRKKIGFIGSFDLRFDLETVEYAVKKLPEFDFEFIGDMRNEISRSRLSKFPNVYFGNSVSPNEVPPLMADCDAGIIPYIMNEVNKNIYPLKINEYMAVGVPVVMNHFATLPEFDQMVSVAKNKIEFVEKLKAEIENDSIEKIKKRIEFASQNSWDARTESFSVILENFIK
jgi:teichuronic acid biosynthesis glycosyltransferase TuaH